MITMMPWLNRSAAQLREQLEREGIPTLCGQVRRRQGKPSGPGRWGRCAIPMNFVLTEF